jgi:hypothetical protein
MITSEVNYENFDWKKYIIINHLHNNFKNKQDAWYHWTNFGEKEGRPFSLINNSRVHHARFGNLFFVNLVVHFICLKTKLKFDYKYYDEFKSLGIDLFIGDRTFEESLTLSDENFFLMMMMEDEEIHKNLIIKNNSWFQTIDYCIFLNEYFSIEKIRGKIIKKNIFKSRYKMNNDVFIHVRLGDIQDKGNNSFEYYNGILEKMSFDKGYISSDTINSEICMKLIDKYNLSIINENEVKTIMFATTCNNIVLSGGTFSWLIGFLAFYSKYIYYPIDKKDKWYGDIFIFDKWIGISE